MSEVKKQFYKAQAETIIKNLAKRHMSGYYCETMEEAKEKVLELIGESTEDNRQSVAYGGSMTIDDTNLKQMIVDAGHDLIVREKYGKSKEETRELMARQITADTFLMSTNAITLDGELVNIDGRGNRVSYLIYGPSQVIILAGMNKVAKDLDEAVKRARNTASPQNTMRLHIDSPCTVTGTCSNCLKNTICCQFVITRASMIHDRIKVVLVGENAGY